MAKKSKKEILDIIKKSSKNSKSTKGGRTSAKVAVAAGAVAATTKHKGLRNFAIFVLVVAIIAGMYFGYVYARDNGYLNGGGNNVGGGSDVVDGELQIHFLELGNKYSGDSIYIKAGDVDILVDAGSRQSSINTIGSYIEQYMTDDKLEYAIITHADQDHIAAFAGSDKDPGVFERYQVDTIIDFPRTNKETNLYNRYVEERTQEIADGAVHYTALQCYNNSDGASRIIELTDSISIEILYQEYYEEYSSDENNYSVCFQIDHSGKKFLFTGDLEEDGEESLASLYTWDDPVELFKAGHHGSRTSSNDELLSKIQPKIVTVTCSAGSTEYTKDMSRTFPTQDMLNRVSAYTDKVYVTTVCHDYKASDYESMNGNIVVSSTPEGVTVVGSNNSTILKDTEWFRANRDMPIGWQ